MENQRTSFLVVGGGKMGEAILSGWIASDADPAASIEPADITVIEPAAERREFLVAQHGVTCLADASLVVQMPDVVVLAVKPQVMNVVLEGIAQNDAFHGGAVGPLFISIAAGLTTDSISAGLPVDAKLVRVMPNMPLAVAAGASGVCAATNASAESADYVASLFGCLGRAVVVDESLMDIVCALSGSGPAYVAAMIEALRDAAAAQGLDADLAQTLALQTVLGTARLIDETGMSPAQAREAICSPGGTTLAALDAMNEAGFAHVFEAGVQAAIERSKELAQCCSS